MSRSTRDANHALDLLLSRFKSNQTVDYCNEVCNSKQTELKLRFYIHELHYILPVYLYVIISYQSLRHVVPTYKTTKVFN